MNDNQPKVPEVPKVTIGAFLDGKLVCSITCPNQPRHVEQAKRVLSDSYGPEATLYRKL